MIHLVEKRRGLIGKLIFAKKFSENRTKATATGGGPNNIQHILSKDIQ